MILESVLGRPLDTPRGLSQFDGHGPSASCVTWPLGIGGKIKSVLVPGSYLLLCRSLAKRESGNRAGRWSREGPVTVQGVGQERIR